MPSHPMAHSAPLEMRWCEAWFSTTMNFKRTCKRFRALYQHCTLVSSRDSYVGSLGDSDKISFDEDIRPSID